MKDPNELDIVAYTLIEDRKVLAYLTDAVAMAKAYLDANCCFSTEERQQLTDHAREIKSLVEFARKDAGL